MAAPFILYEPPGDLRAFEQTLRRYCATTTGDVVVELRPEHLEPAVVRVLAGMRRHLRRVGRRLVVGHPNRFRASSRNVPSLDGRAEHRFSDATARAGS